MRNGPRVEDARSIDEKALLGTVHGGMLLLCLNLPQVCYFWVPFLLGMSLDGQWAFAVS